MQTALRLISLGLILIALVLLGADAIASFDRGGALTVRSAADVWTALGPGSIAAFRSWTEHHWPAAAIHAFDTILTLPGWAISGVPGVFLNFLSGRNAPDAL